MNKLSNDERMDEDTKIAPKPYLDDNLGMRGSKTVIIDRRIGKPSDKQSKVEKEFKMFQKEMDSGPKASTRATLGTSDGIKEKETGYIPTCK